MAYPKGFPTPYVGLVAPYNNIPDYSPLLILPEYITVLYPRLSQDDKKKGKEKAPEEDSDSIINQKLILAKFAQENKLPNPIFFVDDGISGTTFAREGVQAALALAEAGRVKNFIVKDLSRFGRDRLKVDYYLEVMFPDLDVRFVAINDGIDTSKGENDMAPIRSMFNEWYARDTSRKIKAVKRAKGLAGERIASFAPFGYTKDPQNKKVLIVDEEAAEVVKKIFRMCMEGLGVSHIASRLRNERILTPTCYYVKKGLKTTQKVPDDPCDWETKTICDILARKEYLGHTVNFKTQTKSFKTRKQVFNAPEDQMIFENTHPAIIDQETFDRVQKLREGRRRNCKNTGRVDLFSGLIFCKDCGSRMCFSTCYTKKPEQDWYACAGTRKKINRCVGSHYIRSVVLKRMVLDYLEQVREFAEKHEQAFVSLIMQDAEAKKRKMLSADKKHLSACEMRVAELDTLFQRIYEDNAFGKINDEQFKRLSERYEKEQVELRVQVANLAKKVAEGEQELVNVEQFLRAIRKKTDFSELTPTTLHELIERIEVHRPDKSSGKRVQEITIHLNFIGEIGKLHKLRLELEELENGGGSGSDGLG